MKEYDIRPQSLLDRYVELSSQDAEKCFSGVKRRKLHCVACDSKSTSYQFSKHSFEYSICNCCGTLYQSPRPNVEAFEEFYCNSDSSRYWAEVFFPAVAEVRREKIFKPRVERLTSICTDRLIDAQKIIDIGAGYGIFLDEWRKKHPTAEMLAIEPSISLANECRNKGLDVVESIAEKVIGYDDYADLVVCFEVLEHVDDPFDFISVMKAMAKPGGYVFVSTLCIDGFDLQMLWDNSTQISPPHHINFLSIKGFESVFKRAGLSDVSVITPGLLDVNIVQNFIKNYPEKLKVDSFLKKILSNEDHARSFQKFLSDNQLSSHAWVIGRKPN